MSELIFVWVLCMSGYLLTSFVWLELLRAEGIDSRADKIAGILISMFVFVGYAAWWTAQNFEIIKSIIT